MYSNNGSQEIVSYAGSAATAFVVTLSGLFVLNEYKDQSLNMEIAPDMAESTSTSANNFADNLSNL